MKFNLDENPDKTAMDRSTTPKMRQLMQYLNKPITVSYAFKRVKVKDMEVLQRRKSKSLFADVRPPTVPPPMIVASGVFLFDMLFIKKTEYSKITIRSGGLLKNEKELRFKSTDSHFLDRIVIFFFVGSASLNFWILDDRIDWLDLDLDFNFSLGYLDKLD
ncbi:unnamed protein product [Rhizophagus irregularis]|nr:unnamed protein product [Rhizophagus irregularis]